jgi:hypothetical protein
MCDSITNSMGVSVIFFSLFGYLGAVCRLRLPPPMAELY